ncbi:MAG: glycoside hydrolase family 88 protein [Candidatus Alcyoniella australis]|nr:glycoside hydrolase family 88 protein [Candidatus Alcyoniella australis]
MELSHRTRLPLTLFALVALLVALLLCIGCDTGDDDDDDDQLDTPPSIIAACDLADTWIETWEPAQLGWSWDTGILMMGLWELGEYSGEQRYNDYVRTWLDSWIERGYTISWSDHCPPGLLALRLYRQTGEQQYRKVVDDVRQYIFERADRTPDGGLNHMASISGNQLWVDTLFMVTPFLLELGELDQDAAAYDEAALQITIFQGRLQDPDSGLFRHAYDADDDVLMPAEPLFWGRGNGWALVAMSNALNKLPSDHVSRPQIAQAYARQLAAVLPLVEADQGRWHTVLNAPESYLETSISALFAWGIYLGIAADAADPALTGEADAALQGALDQVLVDEADDTLLLGTSFGTSPGDLAHYQEVLKGENVAYGIGIYLLATIERARSAPSSDLEPPRGTDEQYVHPPAESAGNEIWGTFYIARGRFDHALESYAAALEQDPSQGEAALGSATVLIVRAALDLLEQYNLYASGQIELSEMLTFIRSDLEDELGAAGTLLSLVEDDSALQWNIERLLMLGAGGSTALGACEIDAGDALLLHAASELLIGAGYFGHLMPSSQLDAGDEKSIGLGLDHLLDGLDLLLLSIDSIMAETDDQSDDLIPQNLLMLQGEFGLPGILPPTPIDELLADLGSVGDWLAGKPMPDTLVRWIKIIKTALELIRSIFP